MREYDKEKPLIVIHVPKAGGTSIKKIFRHWFRSNLHFHYFNERRGKLPKKVRLNRLFSDEYRKGLCIFGHFNRNRGFGIESYYPEIKQFITILRDPFELVLSEYFYLRKTGANWKDQSRIPDDDIHSYLERIEPNMLNHFPFKLTLDNYAELLDKYFIHIGITEEMDKSIGIIAKKLGFTPPRRVDTVNVTKRTQEIPYELKARFKEKFPVEFAVYEFAKKHNHDH